MTKQLPVPDHDLTTLENRLQAEGIAYEVSTFGKALPRVYEGDPIYQDEKVLLINGVVVANWDRWGYVVDRNDMCDDFLDQGDLDAAIAFIREQIK